MFERAAQHRMAPSPAGVGCAAGPPTCAARPSHPVLAPQLCVLFTQSKIFLGGQIPTLILGKINLKQMITYSFSQGLSAWEDRPSAF